MRIKQCEGQAKQTGFTLVELAIVLVIIGLILGMAFKGKDLIDGAKVKSMAAQYNKVQAAFNIYFEKYGGYPGDGCTALQVLGTFTQCPTAGRNGILDTVIEANSALIQLQNANILTAADLQTPFGAAWGVSVSTSNVFPPAGTNYLSFTNANAAPIATVADARYVCALDRMIDNGDSGAVAVGGAGTVVRSTTAPLYTSATDCWARTGTANIGLRLLP
ncbi:prepilin-type N-terminal cleavage/methylation domain-containing protein [Iodobacter sp. CM08]|uniref:type II secretion system protein n=1 Tax=Iodobacter sp. CM08 TaxID=3085902 RepID=UPI00298288D9|nr:prepilin-type N-terminal cleavage/methylation domain-containing protein [Iodobacter sp. CM08]MDW5415465.1 prepilin-type N-terminal cleavage/methylation domain-containing protein [Iodobacter sp. CM08]